MKNVLLAALAAMMLGAFGNVALAQQNTSPGDPQGDSRSHGEQGQGEPQDGVEPTDRGRGNEGEDPQGDHGADSAT